MELIPDDIVRECLLRVPYKSHYTLKGVCRSWEATVSSPKFYEDRKISRVSEYLLCLIRKYRIARHDHRYACVVMVYDPVKRTWENLPPIDDARFAGIPQRCKCVAVNRKLVLIGGYNGSSHDTSLMKSVHIYDFESASWSRGSDMPTPRSFFACSVSSSTGLVYVAGGINETKTPLAAAEVYDVEKNTWEILPHMNQPHGHACHGVFMEGKFMVISGTQLNRSAEVYDPRARSWRMREDMWRFGGYNWKSIAVTSSSGELYAFSGQEVLKYGGEKNVWSVVASLPRFPLCYFSATQWGNWIFVSGCDKSYKDVAYLFNPSTGQWVDVRLSGGPGSTSGIFVSAATVQI